MKCYRDLFKKKKIKTMNNKMAINTYLSTNRSKKQMVGGLPEGVGSAGWSGAKEESGTVVIA